MPPEIPAKSATAPAPVRPAATIMLLRDQPSFEVLMVKRHHQIDFASGALVFPGGKTHAGDHDLGWADRSIGWDDFPVIERELRIAAIREAYEEAGADHLIVMTGSPFDLAPIEKYLAQR